MGKAPLAVGVACLALLSCAPRRSDLDEELFRYLQEQIRGSDLTGCYSLESGEWDGGWVREPTLGVPSVLRLDSVPQGMGLSAGYRASLGLDVDRLFLEVSWTPRGADSLFVVANGGVFSGYSITAATRGDSLYGIGEEFSDALPVDGSSFRSHVVRGRKVPCEELGNPDRSGA